VTMGAGLRPEAKAADEPPDPTVRAPVLDPTGGGLMEKVLQPVDRHCCCKRTHKRIPAQAKNLASFLPYTSRLDLTAVVPPALDQFLERAGAFRLDLDRMRNFSLSDSRVKELIHDAFSGPDAVAPLRLFPVVSRLFFEDEEQRARFPDRSLWSLNNSFTEAVKTLKHGPRHAAGLRVGRMFGRILHRARSRVEPIAVIDGIELN
jgi:hypothetical protein